MASRHTLFRIFYRVGYVPWEGHPLPTMLRELIEGTADTPALPPGSALDLGCGTGDASIYLAQHGWQVTGVDFAPKALDKARAKARAADVAVNFVHADVTHLRQAGINADFQLIVDIGTFHGMSDDDKDLYVHEISAAAAPGARLLIVALKSAGPLRFLQTDQVEIERRFTPAWALLSAADEPLVTAKGPAEQENWSTGLRNRFAARCYLLGLRPACTTQPRTHR
jgi:cyclopropane fatty-acyl-phospholipid synthase-like methyltransferase